MKAVEEEEEEEGVAVDGVPIRPWREESRVHSKAQLNAQCY